MIGTGILTTTLNCQPTTDARILARAATSDNVCYVESRSRKTRGNATPNQMDAAATTIKTHRVSPFATFKAFVLNPIRFIVRILSGCRSAMSPDRR